SNIPAISEYVFEAIDPSFATRAKTAGGGIVVGGNNYGQGSSREHAALAPMYLGIRAVIAKSFARIHKANLVNFGILPLTFSDPADFDRVDQGDRLVIANLLDSLATANALVVRNDAKGEEFGVKADLSSREVELIKAGGQLNYIRNAR
ncbi:MAG: aconitate hydratase, partial [Dehalococcoidia bacterium]|nr:aconitate hydratase [Dehalococcoidia bacterium]